MHHIWNIHELVDLIFDFLAIRDAAKAATVCRSFWLMALAHIWRDIDDFSNLLNLLPKIRLFPRPGRNVVVGHFPIERNTPTNRTLVRKAKSVPQRRLKESEWERFLLHSKYTKSLSVLLGHETLEASLRHRYLPDLPHTPILPNLSSTKLKISSPLEEPSLELVSLVLPQTVSEVRIGFSRQDSESSVRRILQMLAEEIKLPNFRSFYISGLDCSGPEVRASISQVLQSRPGIQAVKIGLELGSDVMEVLNAAGELPGLRHLDLRVLRSAFTVRKAPRLLFPALETINITGPLPFIVAAFSCAGSENLHSVRMVVKKSPRGGQHQAVGGEFLLFKCLFSTERLIHLKALDLESEVPVSMGDLCHVLTCRDIETLRIVGTGLRLPGDWSSLFEKMVETCPRLMELEIRCTSYSGYEGHLLGLSHLQLLATRCRALRRLCIAVVAEGTRNPALELGNGARFENNVMQKLEVACALRGDVTEMWLVMILRTLWPGLHVVSSDRKGNLDKRSVVLSVTLGR